MSKHKTRQQKIIAQLHRKLEMQQVSSVQKSEVSTYAYTHAVKYPFQTPLKITTTFPYIKHDLFKTTIVTSVIIGLQLLLYYSLKTHLITLPIIGY